MAGVLLRVCRSSSSLTRLPSSLQQRRFAGDLPVKTNPHIENWATYRENVEQTFKFDGKNLRRIVIFVGLVPFLIYKGITNEMDKADDKYHRERRDHM